MTLRCSILLPRFEVDEPPVEVDEHYIQGDGSLLPTPTRSHTLRREIALEVMLHSRLALVINRGMRDRLVLQITHGDAAVDKAMELTTWCVPELTDPVEMDRMRILPGEMLDLTLVNVDVVEVREIEWMQP